MEGRQEIVLSYPDGPFDAEALMIDPVTGDLFIATKNSINSRIYRASRAQLDGGGAVELTFIREITFSGFRSVSAGDISPDGRLIAMRRNARVWWWTRGSGQSVGDALGGSADNLTPVPELNGEALAFHPTGLGLYTLSEGYSQTNYFYRRTDSGAPRQPVVLIGPGETWRYQDLGTDEGVAWRQPAFNDNTWASGAAQLGYGQGDEQTTVSFGPDEFFKNTTTYFRKRFTLASGVTLTNVALRILFTDGAAVLLERHRDVPEESNHQCGFRPSGLRLECGPTELLVLISGQPDTVAHGYEHDRSGASPDDVVWNRPELRPATGGTEIGADTPIRELAPVNQRNMADRPRGTRRLSSSRGSRDGSRILGRSRAGRVDQWHWTVPGRRFHGRAATVLSHSGAVEILAEAVCLSEMKINIQRLGAEIDQLAGISEQPAPVVTRVLFSDSDLRAREYVKGLCREAGLIVRQDAVGNLFARWEGANNRLPPVATGSHIDAIPNAGRYDGVVGVLGGIEAIRALQQSGFKPARSIELIVFTAEEPTRFGIGCLGSRLLSGALSAEKAAAVRDADGKSLDQWRTKAGLGAAALPSVALSPGSYAAFVELHIEQGPLLERENIPIGVVEKIAAPSTLRVLLTGEGGHAGAVLMPDRHDALLAGAEIALAVERAVLGTGSPDTVGTTGIFRIEPGAVNSVPCRAWLEIDLRDTTVETRDAALVQIEADVVEICKRRGVQWELHRLNVDPPAPCDARLVEVVESACQELKLACKRMISRAYHDSLFMAQLCPTTMIFIPCRGGVSHRPDEYSSPEQIANGVQVLARTLSRLAS